MILYNPTKNKVEFIYDSKHYILDPRESKTVPDVVGVHAIERFKAPLVEYSPIYDREMTKTDMNYETMPWGKLKTLASARHLFEPGMNRVSVENALKAYDSNNERGAIQEPFNQEEGEGS